MPIHIGEFTSELTVGEAGLSPEVIEQIAALVEQRLDDRKSRDRHLQQTMQIQGIGSSDQDQPPGGLS